MSKQEKRRYVISNLGFSWAVHDTEVPQQYAFETGKNAEHISSNQLNTRRVALFPTRDEAVREALRLNAAS